jgi:hypothetical protein
MSSLPTTPTSRPRGSDQSGLLPSVDLVAQTEPPRYGRFIPETPTPSSQRRKSRESTISVEDAEDIALTRQHNEELARQAYSFVSGSGGSSSARRREAEEEVYESQASQAASAMLRRDPRESFEVASSIGSRDGTPVRGSQVSSGGYVPAATEKSAKLQAKLFAGLNKSGVAPLAGSEKRKFSGGAPGEDEASLREREALASPTKKLRMAGGLRDPGRVGLGIRYGQDS